MRFQPVVRAARWLPSAITMGALACAAMIAVPAGGAMAAPEENLFLKYHLRAAGFRVATLRFEIAFTPEGYQVQSSMKTKGLLNFIASTKFKASAVGALRKFKPVPARYDMKTESLWKGDREHSIVWNRKGAPEITRSWQIGDYKTQSLKKTIRNHMPDPLSALLTASFQNAGQLCKDKYRVLDGKTVYDLVYSYQTQDDFSGEEPSVYRGEAHKCVISYRPVAGLSVKKWQKLEKQANKGRESFTIWMAPVKAPNINRRVFVPVGGEANMDGRQIYAHLVHASMSGKALNELSVVSYK